MMNFLLRERSGMRKGKKREVEIERITGFLIYGNCNDEFLAE